MAKEDKKKLKEEKNEAWMRIPVGIVSGIVIYVWAYLIAVFFLINFFYKIFTGKKIEDLSRMSECWNSQMYHFNRYMTFCTNQRPFPFEELKKDISKVE